MKHPLEREHTHPKKEVPPVKGPEDSDVMKIITERKNNPAHPTGYRTGPPRSEKTKQTQINKLVEKRDPNAGKRKIKTKTTKTKVTPLPPPSPPSPKLPPDHYSPPSAIDKIKKKFIDKIKKIKKRTNIVNPLNPFKNL